VSLDLLTDSKEGVPLYHLAAEGFIVLSALLGVVVLIRGAFALKHSLAEEMLKSTNLKEEAELWRKKAKTHIEGLGQEIDRQLAAWKLSTTEKTTRAQATVIYEKSGLNGRSELSAFFLEDLLLPSSQQQ
jgi:hypothetical protein